MNSFSNRVKKLTVFVLFTFIFTAFGCESKRNVQHVDKADVSIIDEAKVLLACAEFSAENKPSRFCTNNDLSKELSKMSESLKNTDSSDGKPEFDLNSFKLEVMKNQIDDFMAIDDGGLEAIERCSGGWTSYDCLTLVHACSGNWKCYGDDTCACYTCNGGACW